MAVRKMAARDFKFDISVDNRATWIPISGIGEWSFAVDNNEEDTSDFDSGAWGSAMYTQRTASMSLTGFYLVDSSNGNRDPGQAACETAATKTGYAAYRDIRVRCIPSGYTEIGNFVATCQFGLQDFGGSTTDVLAWGVDILFEGKPVGSGVFNYF